MCCVVLLPLVSYSCACPGGHSANSASAVDSVAAQRGISPRGRQLGQHLAQDDSGPNALPSLQANPPKPPNKVYVTAEAQEEEPNKDEQDEAAVEEESESDARARKTEDSDADYVPEADSDDEAASARSEGEELFEDKLDEFELPSEGRLGRRDNAGREQRGRANRQDGGRERRAGLRIRERGRKAATQGDRGMRATCVHLNE